MVATTDEVSPMNQGEGNQAGGFVSRRHSTPKCTPHLHFRISFIFQLCQKLEDTTCSHREPT